ncbi:Asp/Glu-specific dipeptidyl-peptidase [Flavobacterium suaedae]|uniref:Dipeptidyl-peptidase n=1 Tax=Flavobacterium suaedae TaxID=1767027 RepID=A0ABQ1JZ63_9FLAO|nr:S46 family peptidase [Flavobacterium suaedae]GGB81947.1 Asp/Glu-specific dipeptidyl-peptidase [Flavobacterium suaedae]
MNKLLRLLVLLLIIPAYAQQGGMWIPSLLKGMNEKEMKSLGMKMSASDIYDVNHSSLKDAVPHFNGGCTSEVISPKGLLLTNHHCGYGEIQAHSTVEHDYLTDGFWAMSLEEELPNPGMEVTFIVRIEDVTNKILEGVSILKSEEDKQKKIQDNIAQVTKSSPKESYQENSIRTFYEGNQYMLFVTETYKDVRLVGAPPSSIGKFGSDTDNWVWPRHTGDFSLFRIYANKDNLPAEYSEDNVPYTPKHYFPISLGGIEEGDFTLVFGYPGRTQEYLPSVAVEQLIDVINPAKIEVRDAALKVTDAFMRKDKQIKIQYASKYASIANYWKKWIGETQGLKKTNAVAAKKTFEKAFLANAKKAGKMDEYGNLFNDFEKYYNEIEPYQLSRDYFIEVAIRNVELLTIGYRLYQLEQIYNARGAQSFTDRKNNTVKSLEGTYKDYSKKVDEKVFEQLIALYAEKSPEQFLPDMLKNANTQELTQNIYTNSKLTSYDGVKELLNTSNEPEEIIKTLNADPGYELIKAMMNAYIEKVAPKYEELTLELDALQRTYMKGILELSPKDARIFPDANSTMRVTYGQVKGYEPRDAVYYQPVTYLDGVIEKYVPGDYEFDVPQKLINLYNTKNYGPYGENGKMPVCFLGTNHTTGGNSGSPAIDAKGNLIGLNFDRVWEGTMSDVYYDPAICRNIMVDIRYVLFIIDKYAGAKRLIDEMELVNVKKR